MSAERLPVESIADRTDTAVVFPAGGVTGDVYNIIDEKTDIESSKESLMKKLLMLLASIVAVSSSAAAEEYDYFRNARYPGHLREDVGLDTVEQAPDVAGQPGRRVVHWWPKRGVDRVDVPEGAPLRTWTIRTVEEEPLVEMGYLSKWWDAVLRGRKQFKAHLIGFRGIGSELGDPFEAEAIQRAFGTYGKGWCPAVVLRLEDGRKRCFTRGSLSNEDQEYVTKIYVEEMDRIRQSLENLPRTNRDGFEAGPVEEKLYQPGTFRVQTQHFVVFAGSQSPVGRSSPWVDAKRKDETTLYRKATLGVFEDFWAYSEYAGHLMPWWERDEGLFRYEVVVPGTMADGFGEIPGFAGGGYGGCGIRDAAWPSLFHEWGHGALGQGWAVGGGETFCDAHQTMADPTYTQKVSNQVDRPYKNLFHGSYPGGLIYTLIGDDPNWGHAFISSVACQRAPSESTPMHTIARIGRDRGLWKKGRAIRGVGDLIGQLAARFAEFDCETQAGMRQMFPAPLHQFLYPLDRETGLYRCNMAEAPQPFGCNHILLKAEPGAKKITVDFRGHFDPAAYSDWRACIVGVDDKGHCRYSPLWNRGEMSLDIKEGDQRYWLAVTATPTALVLGAKAARLIYDGDDACKYPYDVKLAGCRPGGPNVGIGVNDNWDLNGPDYYATKAISGGPGGRCYDWPHPSDTPEYARMKRHLEPIVADCKAYSKRLFDPELFPNRFDWWHNRILTGALFQDLRAQYLLDNALGSRHPNGGGWVAQGCKVAPAAYVGPDAMVLDGAQVLDQAIVEDYAVVSGKDVVIKDHARIFGGAVVCGAAEVSGFARVSRNISNRQLHLIYNREGHPDAPDYEVKVYPDMQIQRTTPERHRYHCRETYVGPEANYGMDHEETVLLVDLFREPGKRSAEPLCHDGILYNQPGFTVDGEHRGYTFNGKDQYAEPAPMVADFGAITVDVSLKLGGSGERTILDFGSSAENCFKLIVSPSGAPTLVTVVDGKRQSLAAPPIPADRWTTVRVEIDGKTQSIFCNGEKVASRASTFRPLDVFPGGCTKRNFLAATRNAENFFQGALDYVQIFSATPKTADAQRVAEEDIDPGLERIRRWHEQLGELRAERSKLGQEEIAALEKEAEAFRKKFEEFRAKLGEQYDARPDVARKLAKAKELGERIARLREELDKNNTEIPAKRKLMEEAGKALSAIEDKARQSVQKEVDALRQQAGEFDARYKERVATAKAEDAGYQEALKARNDIRDKLANLPKDTASEKRDELRRQQREIEQQYRAEENRVAVAPGVVGPREQAEALRRRAEDVLRNAVDEAPGHALAAAKVKAARDALREAERRRYNDPRMHALNEQLHEYDTQAGRRAFVQENSMTMAIELKKKEAAVRLHEQRVQLLNNADEYWGLGSWSAIWGAPSVEFVKRYSRAAHQRSPIGETEKTWQQVLEEQSSEWVTEINWDPRMKLELDGLENLEPHLVRWLKRVKPYAYD